MSHSESPRTRLLAMLEDVAEALGDELEQVVFVGGIAASFHTLAVRLTDDVDCMVDMALPAYYRFSERLRSLGFSEEPKGNVICRWRLRRKQGHVTLDVVPTRGDVLGFSTRWYPEAFVTAESVKLASGKSVRVITPLYLVATKMEAFKDRGEGDYEASHDLEDMIAVLTSHPETRDEIARGHEPVDVSVRGDLITMRRSLVQVLAYHLSPDEQESQIELLTHWLLSLTP